MSESALASSCHELTDVEAFRRFAAERGWGDGLPLVPPTPEAVARCLQHALVPADDLVGVEPVRGVPISAEKLAVNAVLAGCEAVHFPVVLAAFRALLAPAFLLHGATSSTGGCAILTVINGSVREDIGADAGFSVLGGGDPACMVIGRALRLALRNLLDVRPGGIDRSTLGHPGKLGYCLAEDEAGTPWQPLAQQRGMPADASAVTVMAAGAPRQVMNEWTSVPEEILETYAAEMRANMLHYSIWAGNYAIVVPPQHRAHLDARGWSKADVARCVFERARVRRGDWADVGKAAVVRERGEQTYRALDAPEDLLVIAAGGPAGGFGAVIPPWLGPKSRAVTAALGACLDCEPG